MKLKPSLSMRALVLCALFAVLLPAGAAAPAPTPVSAYPVVNRSFFGMDLYITGLERPKDEKIALLNAAQDLGVKWSREEMSWANLEPNKKGDYNWGGYDPWINELVKRGISVVGTIQTSPSWASGVPSSTQDWYWYVPRNPQDFADFAGAAAAHYANKINTWEIWNEPDVESTFKCNGCDRAAVYAQMLASSYSAIKRANPNAVVLIGGLSIHDYNNQGMAFLNQVVADSGGQLNFDVLSIHPYMPDRQPESTDPNTVVQNFPYRLEMSYKWLQDHNAASKEIWITEDGYSTCNCGSLGVSEEEQARRLVRLNVIAMASPGVTQFDYFQLKDKFNAGPGDLWGNMGIMRNDLGAKPAYFAYRVMTRELEGATFTGQGPLMHQVANRWQPQYDRYHYKFAKAGSIVHVLWRTSGQETVSVPVTAASVRVRTYSGNNLTVPVQNHSVTVTISEDPLYVIESAPSTPNSTLDPATDKNSPTGFAPSARFAAYWQNNGGLPFFGYAISGERMETSPTDGKQYVVQWFERARMEYHPEYKGTNAEILLGLLGSQLAKGRAFLSIAPPANTPSECRAETGHCIWGLFLERWRALGGIPIAGLPLSDQFEERGTDGKTYIVQYFERVRMEYHPQNQAPFNILLGLLGRQLFQP